MSIPKISHKIRFVSNFQQNQIRIESKFDFFLFGTRYTYEIPPYTENTVRGEIVIVKA